MSSSDQRGGKPNVIEYFSSNDEPPEQTKFSWPPLESNPEVFTNYLQSIGLPSTFSIGEVFGFDEELLAFLPQPVLGIIVCYERLIPKSERREQDKGSSDDYDKVSFYMHQSKVLDNACGIIACLHAVFNSPVVSVDAASVLGKFRRDADGSTPTERCAALEKNTEFQNIHKTHASRGQSRTITSDQSKVRHHFIAYVLEKEGGTNRLIELDGTKAGPVVVGDCGGDLLRGSIREIRGKLERGEISESLSMMTLNLAQE
eukprot:CAMPEP_0181081512 /NCGR_PEP_ID=MMETSP1071-20121207/3139_1 /TAXON_ID=35127 /ORGANISM="Thalassiosira sp., Strain NH16" /LENGTH=258 /DNA_ID=CAMNT_0023163059 /DNA_START=111 /DNA_END=887 /DNA_ORIENTATION=+